MSLAENRFVVGVGKQGAKGTPVAATTYPRWGDGTVFQPDLKSERIREGDGTAGYTRLIKNLQYYKGKIVHAKPRAIDLGFFLKAVNGVASDAITGAGDPYTHTFTPQLTRDYYTIWPQYQLATPEALKIVDAQLHSMTIEGQAGKLLNADYEFAGLTQIDDTSAMTPSYDSIAAPYHYVNGTFTVDGVTGSGTVAPFVTKVKISHKHPLDDTMQTEVVTLNDFVSTVRDIEVEYELLFQDFTQYKKTYWNSGSTDSALVGTGGLTLVFFPGGDSSLVSRTLTITIPTLHYEAAMNPDPKLSGKAFRQQCKGVAVVSPEITYALKNSQSTAY